MNTTLLKMNADVLVEVVETYERLRASKSADDPQVQQLRGQIVYLLTAVRKGLQ